MPIMIWIAAAVELAQASAGYGGWEDFAVLIVLQFANTTGACGAEWEWGFSPGWARVQAQRSTSFCDCGPSALSDMRAVPHPRRPMPTLLTRHYPHTRTSQSASSRSATRATRSRR